MCCSVAALPLGDEPICRAATFDFGKIFSLRFVGDSERVILPSNPKDNEQHE